jgi:hypothetical protein
MEPHALGPDNEHLFDDEGQKTIIGIGAVAAAVADYVTVTEFGNGAYHRTVLDIAALPIETVDNGTAGHAGGTKLYDFPKGYLHILSGVQKWDLLTADGTGIPNDAELDIAVGSTVATTDMGALSGTAENIVNKDDITLSSSVSATDQLQAEVTGGGVDGSATASDAYLNLAGTAATCDANGVLTVTGTIEIVWVNLGYCD